MNRLINFLLLYLLMSNFAYLQTLHKNEFKTDKINLIGEELSIQSTSASKQIILPIFLMIGAISLNEIQTKQSIQYEFDQIFKGVKTKLDDYTPFLPVCQMYGYDMLKYKTRHNSWNKTKFLAISQIISTGIVLAMKKTFSIQRPDQSDFNSFPSGHTAVAFVSSQVLYNEYAFTNKYLAYSGLIGSISTATLRILNNRHWLPDVLMGAGIGILTTNLVYHFKPFKNWNPWKMIDENLSFSPIVSINYFGFQIQKSL
jgi:hypothetical protein